MTSGSSPARWAEIAAARPHGPAPTITRSTSFCSRVNVLADGGGRRRNGTFDSYDLIPPRADADIGDRCLDQGFDPVEVSARCLGQIRKSTRLRRGAPPPVEPFVSGSCTIENTQVTRKL